MAESSGGLRLDAVVRKGACGTWWAASTADGRTRGLLQLDPALTSDPAAVERAAEKVAAVRALNMPGVLRTTDLVADAGRVWLVAAAPPVPVFTDLAATGLDPAAAAFLALDVGNALVGLHSAGLCHGALGPETVAVTGAGFAMLTEVGLRPALTGSTRDAAADARAWCRLVRVLAGNPGNEAATRAFAEAAGLVELGGVVALESALGALTETASAFGGFPSRTSLATAGAQALAQTTTGTSRAAQASSAAQAAVTAPPAEQAESLLARTQLGRRAAAAAGLPVPSAAPESEPADADPAEDGAIRLRFGPGVPAAPVGERANGRPIAPAGAGAPRRRTLWTVLSGALTLVMVLAAGAIAWWRYSDALAVTGISVDVVPAAQSCDVTVDIIGTVRTNGRSGLLRYEWVRNDGQTSGALEQRLNAGTSSTEFRLRWTFNGKGTYDAAARLRILAPTAMESADEFTYHC